MIAAFFLPVLLLFQVNTTAQPTPQKPPETPTVKPAAAADTKEEPPVITKHTVRIGSRQLNYTVTTGFMPIKNAVSGDIEAKIFYMAYTLNDPPAGRPLMFSFNGGPGSASVWLHLGTLGPRRVKMLDRN